MVTFFGGLQRNSKETFVECVGQQLADRMSFDLAVQIGHHDFDLIAAKFGNHLAAGSAGRNRRVCVGDDRDARELPGAFGNRLAQRHALSAHRQAVAGIFNVAAGEDSPVTAFDRRADLEP